MITIKLKLKDKHEEYDCLLKEFNKSVRLAYNCYRKNSSIKDSDVEKYLKSLNINLDASFIKQSVLKAKELKNKEKVIFGGKKNFRDRLKGLISKEEYREKRLLPIRVVGSKNDNGNRKFSLDISNHQIIFKPNRSNHYKLEFISGKNQLKLLKKFQEIYDKNKKSFAFTIELNKNYIWITVDELICKNDSYKSKNNRIASIDMNPNYVALVIQDNEKIMLKKLYSLKELNDLDKKKNYKNKENKIEYRKYLHNKRKFETLEISKNIVDLCKQYHVESFVIEDLSIKSSNKKLGRRFNKSCNNDWLRNSFAKNLEKRCNLIGIKFHKVFSGWSSIKGQLENEKEIDSIAAAIEIGKRKDKNLKNFGNTKVEVENLSNRWKKEINSNFKQVPTWRDISEFLKNKFKNSYRNLFSIEKFNGVSYSLNSNKSYIKLYCFI